MYNPLGEDNISKVSESTLDGVRDAIFPGNENRSINGKIEEVILKYLHEQKQFDKVSMLDLASILMEKFPNDQDRFSLAQNLQNAIQPFIDSSKNRYNDICDAPVPIAIYSGPQNLLSEIFNRINTKGIALNDYEIYSATWSQKKYQVTDIKIVENVIKKYWALADAGYEVDGFDSTHMRTSKELTAFEFLFGLGKLWAESYDCLKFDLKGKEDEVNEISFEIIDACLNSKKSIASLDISLQKINVNKLKRRVEEAISFVSKSIAIVGSFKGNKRKYNVLHSKYQIVSLISYTFREMYDVNNLDSKKQEWNSEKEREFSNLILSHYVADIISGEWHDGGGAKVYSAINERRYSEYIPESLWNSLLDNYYQTQLQNKQRDRFANPVNADSVILNCIYVELFSAADHLSTKKFDIEHIATKERMRGLMKQFDELRLPVACIANLCYLPEDINRGKKEKTIYEAKDLSLPIAEIEAKYSFTTEQDLAWISKPYGKGDRQLLIDNYQEYLDKRYEIIKGRFISMFIANP